MELGNWQLDVVSGGRLRLDGGSMFGVVPRPLWEKKQPPDERNRIQMATNCLLLRDGQHTALIDTGYGGKMSEREQEVFHLDQGDPLLASLAELDLSPEDIDTVVFSHLHFDHAGGATTRDKQGNLKPTFPNARYVAQRVEWEAAVGNAPELKGSYPLENLLPLKEANQLELIEGEAEIVPGLRGWPTPGHTKGHHSPVFKAGGETVVYLADVCPMQAHLPTMWCMAYDVDLLESRRRKPQVLGQLADENWLVVFCHDPQIVAGRLSRHEKREFVVCDPVEKL